MITNIADNIDKKNKHLTFAGHDVVQLAKKYGTPLYLMDENKIRENCRVYTTAFKKYFGENSEPLYACKANAFKYLLKIMQEENMGVDVVSIGEIYTAAQAGYDLKKAYFHGCCKTIEDVEYGIENKIGTFVVDNFEELKLVEKVAKEKEIKQRILLRITPGIDAHTYAAVTTGTVDSKFGFVLQTGAAEKAVAQALTLQNIELVGYHCHVGSQVTYEDVYERTLAIMLDFTKDMKTKFNYEPAELNLGGGFGIRYLATDNAFDIDGKLCGLAKILNDYCSVYGLRKPKFLMEPGRSIVANAGMTIYTVAMVKRTKGYKNYIGVDGGMTDNPRHALYDSKYTCFLANKTDEEADTFYSIVGRNCESGDIIQEYVKMPDSAQANDIVAVCTTGAYNYSMASNYNRVARPAIVMLKDNEDFEVVKRETLLDMLRNDV